MTHKKRVGLTISYIVLILISIIWLFPFFCLVLQSFRSYQSEFGGMVNYLVPKHFSLDSYKFLFSEGSQFTRWYANTFIIACFVSVL
jgi:arabinogalactan oligomer/maltooligosaccharide transport system permease protein